LSSGTGSLWAGHRAKGAAAGPSGAIASQAIGRDRDLVKNRYHEKLIVRRQFHL
jgi:hypothetical protein